MFQMNCRQTIRAQSGGRLLYSLRCILQRKGFIAVCSRIGFYFRPEVSNALPGSEPNAEEALDFKEAIMNMLHNSHLIDL